MAGRWRKLILLIPWLMTAPMRKRSRKLRRKGKYFGMKSIDMPERLEPKIENRRSLFGIFKDSTPMDQLQLSLPIIQSVQASPVGAAVVLATMQSIARPLYLPGPIVFPALRNQGTSQTLSNYVDCLTFSGNTSYVSCNSQVNCKEVDSGCSCWPGQGQAGSELG